MLRETYAGKVVLWTGIDERELPDGVEAIRWHSAGYPLIKDSWDE